MGGFPRREAAASKGCLQGHTRCQEGTEELLAICYCPSTEFTAHTHKPTPSEPPTALPTHQNSEKKKSTQMNRTKRNLPPRAEIPK
eukprot:3543714-Amphidinium_carterae.1